ncbi:hypothetical protein, conserved [Eimeria tenella]|uniref:Ubiquitin-like domain-containing protein n=1 Tax=Eimeria tenella TaxID=5802 RepID=U6L0P6_EIMTE|nr:hypothetical protein, conserved [Eimeria tenella]CDJ42159.1 hypothetical protein, conserved [Eimeria tenella]|eukprot:XP_013232909.1 hypothetical protein, conserved [Eimeria tenella]
MSDFQLREEEPVDGRTIDDIVDGVAEDLGLSRDAHLEALEDALKDKKLCGVVHPYVADALLNRLRNKPNETFEFDVYPEVRLETRNPTHFKNLAIFVHRVAPIPGSNKGKIACTWAFDVDPLEYSVSELKARLERLALTKMEHMRLVFNGFTLTATNSLADYDIQGGDSLYLYTVKDPNETTAFVAALLLLVPVAACVLRSVVLVRGTKYHLTSVGLLPPLLYLAAAAPVGGVLFPKPSWPSRTPVTYSAAFAAAA